MNNLANVQCSIISPAAFEKYGQKGLQTRPIGTGPFQFKEYKRDTHIKFKRFDDYWVKGLPYLDGLDFYVIMDPMTTVASFKAGQVDAIASVDLVTGKELKEDKNYLVESTPGVSALIAVNTKDPNSMFTDKRIREAIEYAIDKESITGYLGQGFVYPSYQIINKGPEVPDKKLRKYNPEKAKQLLADAGYPNGFKSKLMVLEFLPRDFIVALQDQLAKVGIDLTIEYQPGAAHMQYFIKGGIGNSLFMDVVPGVSFPLAMVNNMLSSKAPFFADVARTPGWDDLIEQALHESDMKKVESLLQQMEKLAYDDAMLIPLWPEPWIVAYKPTLKDVVWFKFGTSVRDYSRAWISKE